MLAYFEGHAIDPDVALRAGVHRRGRRLAFPYTDGDGDYERTRPVLPTARLGEAKQPKGRPLSCWWPAGRPDRLGRVIVCEGESDALAVLSAVERAEDLHAREVLADLTVVAVPGASFPADRLAEALHGAELVILAPDADEAGDKFAEKAAEALKAAGIASVRLELPEGRDLADQITAEGPDRFAGHIADLFADQEATAAYTPPAAPTRGRTIAAVRFADIRTERPRWLWQGLIPLGAPTLLVGREKLGKSTLTVELAAGVTKGTLEGDLEGNPSSALLLSYEDNQATTVKPRLLAAGADPDRVFTASASLDGAPDLVSLPGDVARIAAIVREHECRLIVVDPFSASLGADIDSHRDQDMRRAIASLAQLSEAEGVALLLVAHFSKETKGDALTRVLGSRALTAASRSVLVFGKAPDAGDDSPDRVLAHRACNIAATAPSLACRIVPRFIQDDDGETVPTSQLLILGETDTTAEALLASRSESEHSERDAAADWLEDELADGEWHEAQELIKRADEAGHSRATLYRALSGLDVEKVRQGFPARSCWRLVSTPPPPKTPPETAATETAGENGSTEPNPSLFDGQSSQRGCVETPAEPTGPLADLTASRYGEQP